MAIGAAAIVGTALGLAGSLGSAGLNLYSQYKTNQTNKQIADQANQTTLQNNAWTKENFEKQLQWQKDQYFDQESYARALQEQLFNREDNSYQRTVADIMASGLSPLAINGTNDSGSVVSQAQVPNANVPELSGINPYQLNSLNFGQLADIIAAADTRRLQERSLDIQEEKNLSDTEQRELDRKENAREADAKLEQSDKQFNQSIELQIKEFEQTNKNKAEELKLEQTRVNQLIEQSKLATTKYQAEESERQLRSMTGGRGSTKRFTDRAEYEEAISSWRDGFARQLAIYADKLQSPTSKAQSHGASASVGAAAVVNGQMSSNGSESYSWSNLDESAYAELQEWLVKNPMPVYY